MKGERNRVPFGSFAPLEYPPADVFERVVGMAALRALDLAGATKVREIAVPARPSRLRHLTRLRRLVLEDCGNIESLR